MTTISPNYAGVNFKATEQVQPKKAAETNAQSKPESKGMSNAMKVGIGLGALAAVALAGMAIKNKSAAKKAGASFDNLVHNIEQVKVNRKEVEWVEYNDIIKDVKDFAINSISESDFSSHKYQMAMMSPQRTKEFVEFAKQNGNTVYKDLKLSKNSFMCYISEDGKPISNTIYDAKEISEALFDFWGKDDKIWIKNMGLPKKKD